MSQTYHPTTIILAVTIVQAIAGWAADAGEKGKKPSHPVAVIETTVGTIEAELYPADAPKTVENFIGLAGKKYYDGITFHRVVPGFVIQGGDPTGTGAGGKSLWGGEFADELNASTPSYKQGYIKGVLAMANHGPNTNSSQFFIMLADNTTLPKNYTIFGKVIKGMDVVEKIGHVALNPQTPAPPGTRPVVMKKVRIRQAVPAAKGH
ncbi:MAG TPA: peptidylprolyl isomerase [Bacteroidota bacterium]|nr:peptidylprolyl isomerase [Bacteroidota bacterium]